MCLGAIQRDLFLCEVHWKLYLLVFMSMGLFQERFFEAVHLVCFDCWGLHKHVLGYWQFSWHIATMRLGVGKLASPE